MLETLQNGMGKGTSIVYPEDRNGRGVRVSNNDPWYSAWYKDHGKKPNKAESRQLAIDIIKGEAPSKYIPDGWNADSYIDQFSPDEQTALQEEQAETKALVGALEDELKALESIRDGMSTLTASAMNMTDTLTKEGYRVYAMLESQLENGASSSVGDIRGAEKSTTLKQDTNIYQEQLQLDEKKWADTIDNLANLKDGVPVRIMRTPLALKLAGARMLDIVTHPKKLQVI